jgi:uncharacterized membrane protein
MDSNAQPANSRQKKRAQFTEPSGSKGKLTPILIAVFIGLTGVAAYLVISSSGGQPSSTSVTATASTPAGGSASADVRIPLSDIGDGRARFFDYRAKDNRVVKFFVMRSSDGVYRAALDACDTCYHAKRGYRQEADEMVCNNCGLRFPSALINEVKGGCNPIGLPRAVEGDQLVIKAGELESRAVYF